MMLRGLHFIAIMFAALTLIPSGAHLFALPNKINMGPAQYFTVQSIYSGWARWGFVLVGALIANGVLALMVRGERMPFAFALAAVLCFAASLAVFFVWVFPANQATNNWTAVPANWQSLRTRWEYGHAASAALGFGAFCFTTLAVLTRQ